MMNYYGLNIPLRALLMTLLFVNCPKLYRQYKKPPVMG